MLLKRAKQNSLRSWRDYHVRARDLFARVLTWQRTHEGKLDSLPNFSQLRHQNTTALAH